MDNKKIVLSCAIVLFIISVKLILYENSLPKQRQEFKTNDVEISGVYSREEFILEYNHVMELLKTTSEMVNKTLVSIPSGTYRICSVYLDVDECYKPRLLFFCGTKEDDNEWEIVEVYDAVIDTTLQQQSWLFHGSYDYWKRGSHLIEWVVNGDFVMTGLAFDDEVYFYEHHMAQVK